MKTFKFLFCAMAFAMLALTSCEKPGEEEPAVVPGQFVRINPTTVFARVGQTVEVAAAVDEIKGDKYKLVWSVTDPELATVEALPGNKAKVTGLKVGATVLQVATDDGLLTNAVDLTVAEMPGKVYVDFCADMVSPTPWNTYGSAKTEEPALENLKDINGKETSICIKTTKSFTGWLNRRGNLEAEAPCAFDYIPVEAWGDMIFSDGAVEDFSTSSFQLYGLDTTLKYKLEFYCNINDVPQVQVQIDLVGKDTESATLFSALNPDKLIVFESMEPKADGTLDINMKPGPENTQFMKFFGVNAMILTPVAE